ncbi:MAG: ISL3 family transposase [Planctomycetota bacterium]
MNDKQLYAQILGIASPWQVTDVQLSLSEGKVEVKVSASPPALLCPECGTRCPGYDARERRWRHLDTCQYQTILVADVPRVECPEHGVKQVAVPWAASGSRFTLLFERLVLDWLDGVSAVETVANRMGLGWDVVAGIMDRAVKRGLARRELRPPRRIGVDETSFQKRHEYVTVVTDLDSGKVIYVADGRGREALEGFYRRLSPEDLEGIEVVAMDMSRPYIAATRACVPDADAKIAFDKFHVVKLPSKGVDWVRRREARELRREGDERLQGTRYYWLENPLHMSEGRWDRFTELRKEKLRTARAWAMKDTAMALWSWRHGLTTAFKRWCSWVERSDLAPMQRAAKAIRKHLGGILNAIRHGVSNGLAEGMNSIIQLLKAKARGYRSRERFRMAILFRLGGLDLYPKAGEA